MPEKYFKKFDKGIFLVNVLAVIYDAEKKKVLIGKRENDPYIKKLSWCFPGGRAGYDEELESSLKKEVKQKTGLDIKIKRILFAKTYPEKREFLSVYYLCEVVGGGETAGEKFVELKWVSPKDIENYFTTSFHPQLKNIIINLGN